MPDWTIERVRALSAIEIRSLQTNALKGNNAPVAELCAQALRENSPARRKRHTSAQHIRPQPQTPLDAAAVAAVAKAIVALVPETERGFSENVRANIRRRENNAADAPQLTLRGLWWQYIVCAFSSQERSGVGTAVHFFEHSHNHLHNLAEVSKAGAAPDWVRHQFEQFAQQCAQASIQPALRMSNRKGDIVMRGFPLFAVAGAPTDALSACCVKGGDLKVFCDLARGALSDRNLATSAQFSWDLDPKPYHGISHKQVRNILVNSGLAVNVLPLDSRWKSFLEDKAGLVLHGNFGVKAFYLDVENVLRQALLAILAVNSTFPVKNLAALDAVVFEYYD